MNESKILEKEIHWALSAITALQSERACKIIGNSFTINEAITLITKKEDFECKIFLEKLHDYTYNQNIEKFGIREEIVLESTGLKFYIGKDKVRGFENTMSEPQVLNLKIDHFQNGNDDEFENLKHRLIIPINTEKAQDLIEAKSLKIGQTTYSHSLIKIEYTCKKFHFYTHKNNDTDEKFIIVESLQNDELKSFKKDVAAIMLGYALITGNWFLGEYYYQTINDEKAYNVKVCYEKKESSILTNKSLLDPFQFGQYLEVLKQPNDKFHWMTAKHFSSLCFEISKNDTYARCCRLILEGHSSDHVLLQCSIYSIALEALTNIICEEKKEKVNPIPEKELAAKIGEKLINCVDEYEAFLTDYGITVLTARINDINKPTNSKKLSIPFELYGIELTKDDVKILGYRNKFLHGSSPFKEDELSLKKKELSFISGKFQLLLNSLMLKYIGYNGHVVNYAAWVQYNSKEKITEPFFKVV